MSKNLKDKVLDEGYCIGKLDEADAICRRCDGYDKKCVAYEPLREFRYRRFEARRKK